MRKKSANFLLPAAAVMAFALCFLLIWTSGAGKTGKTASPVRASTAGDAGIPAEAGVDAGSMISTLPASLRLIDSEAFEGTAIRALDLPATVEAIGDRAFAGNEALLYVRFPEGDIRIGEDIFAGSDQAVMAVYAGSEALNLAREKEYRYMVVAGIGKRTEIREAAAITAGGSDSVRAEAEKDETCAAPAREKRTGRSAAELKGEMYRGVAALYVRSRYFP